MQKAQVAMPIEKKNIPRSVRITVWNKYIGDAVGKHKCLCCNLIDITCFDFHCGHIIAESKGGSNTIDNLMPICANCNLSMQAMNLHEFQRQFFEPHKPHKANRKSGKKKQVPYTCPRCDYKTDRRCDMMYHLFTSNRICPGVVIDIELTSTIKDSVIRNRIYPVPEKGGNNCIPDVDIVDNAKEQHSEVKMEAQVLCEGMAVEVKDVTISASASSTISCSVPQPIVCSTCSAEFLTNRQLAYHRSKCDGKHPLACCSCEKMFACRQSKAFHVKSGTCNQKDELVSLQDNTQIVADDGQVHGNIPGDVPVNGSEEWVQEAFAVMDEVTKAIVADFSEKMHTPMELGNEQSEEEKTIRRQQILRYVADFIHEKTNDVVESQPIK